VKHGAALPLVLLLLLNCSVPSPVSLPCEPTIARMVPPQFVMDHVVGGVQGASNSAQPTAAVSREVWASDRNYLGNDVLWVDLPRDGRVRGRSVSISTYEIAPSRIAVTARRTDATPAAFSVERDENPGGGPRDRAVTMVFSARDCWDITFSQSGKDISFVLAVDGP